MGVEHIFVERTVYFNNVQQLAIDIGIGHHEAKILAEKSKTQNFLKAHASIVLIAESHPLFNADLIGYLMNYRARIKGVIIYQNKINKLIQKELVNIS